MSSGHRIASYELIRVVAMAFVVFVHSLPVLDNDWPTARLVACFGKTLFFSANAMFFMMSGRFNLKEIPEGKGQLARFYRKRARSILLPVATLFILRTLWDGRDSLAHPVDLLKALILNTSGRYANMEYWFLFTLIGFLLVTPFLAHMTAKLHGTELKVFVGIVAGLELFEFLAVNLQIPFGWTSVFAGFLLTYLLGPALGTWLQGRIPAWFWASAAASFAATVVLAVNGWEKGAYDISPLYLLSSVGIYAALYKAGISVGKSKVVQWVARRSFTVYLVHGAVLAVLMKEMRSLPKLLGFESFLGFLALAAIALVISLALATVLDLLVVHPLQRAFDKVVPVPPVREATQN